MLVFVHFLNELFFAIIKVADMNYIHLPFISEKHLPISVFWTQKVVTIIDPSLLYIKITIGQLGVSLKILSHFMLLQ